MAAAWSGAPNGGNLHRNVFFRDMNVPRIPLSASEEPDVEKLWQWLAEQRKQGMKVSDRGRIPAEVLDALNAANVPAGRNSSGRDPTSRRIPGWSVATRSPT